MLGGTTLTRRNLPNSLSLCHIIAQLHAPIWFVSQKCTFFFPYLPRTEQGSLLIKELRQYYRFSIWRQAHLRVAQTVAKRDALVAQHIKSVRLAT